MLLKIDFFIVCLPLKVSPCGWTAGNGVVACAGELVALLDVLGLAI